MTFEQFRVAAREMAKKLGGPLAGLIDLYETEFTRLEKKFASLDEALHEGCTLSDAHPTLKALLETRQVVVEMIHTIASLREIVNVHDPLDAASEEHLADLLRRAKVLARVRDTTDEVDGRSLQEVG